MTRFRLLPMIALALAAGAVRAETIDNPEYKSWSAHKAGTTVTMKTVSEFDKMTSEITTTNKLVEVGKDKLVLETEVVSKVMGMEFKQPATKRDVPKTIDIPKADPGKAPKAEKPEKPEGTTEEGTETLKIGATEVKTKWFKAKVKTPAGEAESQTWMSDDVPGGLVKVVSKVGDTKTTIEVTEFKKP
jgi:hypothetical protein